MIPLSISISIFLKDFLSISISISIFFVKTLINNFIVKIKKKSITNSNVKKK